MNERRQGFLDALGEMREVLDKKLEEMEDEYNYGQGYRDALARLRSVMGWLRGPLE